MPKTAIPQYEPGPYSALFDYEEEKKKEEELYKQRQQAQQKIMRTNAIGDALGLLVESVGGSQGATISQRGANPYLVRAVDRYYNNQSQYDAEMRNLNLQQLAQREKDLGRNLAVGDRDEGRVYNEKMLQDQRGYQEAQAAEERTYQQQRDQAAFERQKQLAKLNTDENIRQSKAVADSKLKELINRDRTKPLSNDDILFQIPGTTQKIYLGSEEVAEMAHELINTMQAEGQFISDPTLRAFNRNEVVRDESLIEVIKKNWDKVKYVLPEYASQKPAEPTLLERRMQQYEAERQAIQTDPTLKSRQRVKKLNSLDKDYQDVVNAQKQQGQQGVQLNVNQQSEIDNLINSSITKEQKRSAIYNYLKRNGYDEAEAIRFAEFVYQNL